MFNAMEYVTRGVFGLASVVPMLIALALSLYSGGLIVNALRGSWEDAGNGLMSAIEYESEQPAWEDYEGDPTMSLPRRSRHRYWGRGTAVVLGVLLVAIGFYAGIRVEKGQISSGATASAATGV